MAKREYQFSSQEVAREIAETINPPGTSAEEREEMKRAAFYHPARFINKLLKEKMSVAFEGKTDQELADYIHSINNSRLAETLAGSFTVGYLTRMRDEMAKKSSFSTD